MFLVAILLLVIVSMGLVVLSPLALRALDNGDEVDWNRLSNIGETYGAVSAIVAAVALLGVMVYVNLIVAHWFSEYEVGELPDTLLRATAASVFASAPGRLYWRNTGTFWRDNYSGRRARRFHKVLEETYQEAIKKPTSTPPAPESPSPARADRRWVTVLTAAGGGAAVALMAVRAIRRTLRRH